MEETILIPIDNDKQIEQVLAVLNAIAKSGIRVVVALRQPEMNRCLMMKQWGFMLTGMESLHGVFMDDQERRDALEETLIREKLARWQRECRWKNVEVEVVVCRGSMRPLIEGAKRNSQVGLIMTPARQTSRLSWAVESLARAVNPFRQRGKPAAVLLRPI